MAVLTWKHLSKKDNLNQEDSTLMKVGEICLEAEKAKRLISNHSVMRMAVQLSSRLRSKATLPATFYARIRPEVKRFDPLHHSPSQRLRLS
jgi:hypothetical protein